MSRAVRIGLEEIGEHFESLEDPRSSVNQLHPLESVIVIAVMAVLAGADGHRAVGRAQGRVPRAATRLAARRAE